jgi:hypothetical protein
MVCAFCGSKSEDETMPPGQCVECERVICWTCCQEMPSCRSGCCIKCVRNKFLHAFGRLKDSDDDDCDDLIEALENARHAW